MGYRVLITGSSGMIGKGVLLECLSDSSIEKVIVINRSKTDIKHPKLVEILLNDFTKIESVKGSIGKIDACYHCMGVSALGLSEEQYTAITFDVTQKLSDVCFELNPEMLFIYVSGTGTDSSEKGSQMWARVKGKTENYILGKGFKKALMFRPGAIIPEKGIKSRTGWYNFFYVLLTPFFPLLKKSKNITTTTKMGIAMINALNRHAASHYLENRQINELAG